MSRFVLTLVATLIALTAGCDASELAQEEPTVFSVLYNDVESAPFREDWLLLQEYADRQGVALDVRLGADGEFDEVIRRTFESGAVPDIVLKCWPETIEGYAIQGLLLPFSDYENLMPHFSAYVERHGLQAELDALRLDDGKYYILPGYGRETQVQQWIYRQDLFAKHNLGVPQTYEGLFDSLAVLKDAYPETTPITASWGGAHLFAMMGAGYETCAGWSGTRYYNSEEDRWVFAPATDNYKELYRFLHRCYEAEILDPETFTQTNEEFIGKLGDGRAVVTVTWITSGFGQWNEQLKAHGLPDGKWVPLHVPESTIRTRALPPVSRFRKGLVVPSRVVNEPYFERLLQFLDWAVYSDEGMMLTTWGVEGTTFQNTADGKALLPHIATPKNPQGTVSITAEYGMNLLFNLCEDEEFEDYKKPDEIVQFLQDSEAAMETLRMPPRLRLDDNSSDATGIVNERLVPYVESAGKKFITGELDFDNDWDAYIAEIEKMGYKTLEEIWNSAWKTQSHPN